jgi:hypothetical protein
MSAEVVPSAAQLRRSKLADFILNATMIPYIEETLLIMTLGNTRPTAGVLYSWDRLLNPRILPPEFSNSLVRGKLPRSVGADKLDAVEIVRNEREYIHDLLYRCGQMGYKTAWVISDGIIFYLRPEQLPEQARNLYHHYFMSRQQVQFLQQVQGGGESVVTVRFPVQYSPSDIQFMGYELAIHYQTLNLASYIYTDIATTPDIPTTVLQIFPKNHKFFSEH